MFSIIMAYFLLYSFLGWVCEVVYCSSQEKHFVNRGFLSGPVCPIYGCGAIAVLFFLEPFHTNVWLTFLFGAIAASLIEYITSYLLERIFKLRLWDYSTYAFNLNGRVCLKNSTLFGLLSVALIFIIHPAMQQAIRSLPEYTLQTVVWLLFTVLMVDFITTISSFVDLRKKVQEVYQLLEDIKGEFEKNKYLIDEEFSQRKEEFSIELAHRIKQMEARISLLLNTTNAQHKRILQAFPKLQSRSYKQLKFSKVKDELKKISLERLKK